MFNIFFILQIHCHIPPSMQPRPWIGFGPATWLQYNRMFVQFIAFPEIQNIPLLQVNTIVLLSFMEFCHQSGLSHANIANQLSSIRVLFMVHGLNTEPFKDDRLPLYIKSLKINATFKLKMSKNRVY